MKKILKSKKSKIISLVSGLSLALITTFSLTACSSVNQTLVDSTIAKSSGQNFATNYDLSTFSKEMLLNDSSQKAFLSSSINQMVYQWIEYLATRPDEINYKTLLDAQKTSVDNEYNSLSTNSQSSNGVDYPLKFQQDTLDLNGGTKESWIQKKMLDWAKSTFLSKVYEKDFLSIIDTNTNTAILNPSKAQILDALTNKNNLTYGFSSTAITGQKDIYLDPIFANFQKFVFEKWVQTQNPFIVNMSLWKYSTPTKGIESVYLPPSTSTSTGTTTNPGTYVYPYFSNSNRTNTNGGTIDKFSSFIADAATTPNYIVDNTNGLIEIPTKYTEDSSTFILAKNSTIFNDLYPDFAAASTYQLYKGKTFTDATSVQVTNVDTNLSATVSSTAPIGNDAITSNFVSTSNVNNLDISLSSSLVDKIINPDGEFKSLNGKAIYVADAIKSSNANLSNYIFIRDQAGVHAIAIDGYAYINGATTLTDFKARAGNVVLYRYFMNKYGFSDFSVNLSSDLSTFLSNNFDYLITEYAFADAKIVPTDLQMFNISASFPGGVTTANFLRSLAQYLFDASNSSIQENYQNKLYSHKSTYSGNYGTLTRDNGFAAPLVYPYVTNTTQYDLITSCNYPDPFATNGSYQVYSASISNFIDVLALTPLTSTFEGFQYSQYIYTNNYFVNVGLLAFGNDGSSMGNQIKNNILLDYLGADFNKITNTINPTIFSPTTATDFATQLETNINQALANNFFSTVFDGLSQKWINYTGDTNSTITATNFFNYLKDDLWLKSNSISSSTAQANFLSLYTLVATAKYLLANNGAEFIKYLQTKISIDQDSYITWYGSTNSYLQATPITDVGNLINTTKDSSSNTLINKNLNNSFQSSYFGSTPSATTAIDKNNGYSSVFSSTSNYYKLAGNNYGFAGLQTTNANSAPNVIKERLFTKQLNASTTMPSDAAVGLLYSYISRDNLVNIINNYSVISEIDALAKSLYTKIGTFSIDSVILATTIAEKKAALISIVNNVTYITNEMFSPKTGYISSDQTLTTSTGKLIVDPTSTNISYGAKSIQLNTNDISSLDNLQKALNVNNLFTKTEISNIFFNLVIQAASDSTVQDQAISSIVATRKLDVYDVRLNNQLGPRWASNWK